MALETLLHERAEMPTQVFVNLVDDAAMSELNQQFRSVNETTDVLSFESNADSDVLGDIVICVDQAARQAEERCDTFTNELALLAIHGGLHLFRMNDDTPSKRKRMLEEMYAVAARSGLACKSGWQTMSHGIYGGGKR